MAGLLVKSATVVDFNSEAFARCTEASTAAVADAGLPDPTELALSMLLELLTQQHGVAEAATVLARLGSALDEEHRKALRRVLFGV